MTDVWKPPKSNISDLLQIFPHGIKQAELDSCHSLIMDDAPRALANRREMRRHSLEPIADSCKPTN
jgi:hypothetical protein